MQGGELFSVNLKGRIHRHRFNPLLVRTALVRSTGKSVLTSLCRILRRTFPSDYVNLRTNRVQSCQALQCRESNPGLLGVKGERLRSEPRDPGENTLMMWYSNGMILHFCFRVIFMI